MLPRAIRQRRGRRTDFVAIVEILASSGIGAPLPDRAALRRFRRIIADLGSDLYIALAEERLAGFVHVTYARQITGGPRARIEALVVTPEARRCGIGSSLVHLARLRATRRGCRELCCSMVPSMVAARQFLTRDGWRVAGDEFCIDLDQPAQ